MTSLTKVQYKLVPPELDQQNCEMLSLALEPEVAAVHCKKVAKERNAKCANSKSYMIVDIGGGTVDITAHRVDSTGAIDVVLPPTGNDCGGTQVNRNFEKFLGLLVDDPKFNTFYPEDDEMKAAAHRAVLDKIVNETFEDHKQYFGNNFHQESSESVVLQLPHKFMRTYSHTLENIEKLKLNRFNCQIEDNELEIPYEKMEQFFMPVVEGIMKCLIKCFAELEYKHVQIDTVFLVGGFGGCKYLHYKIQERLQQRHLLEPTSVFRTDSHELAIVLGAIEFQRNPSLIQSRKVDATYGASCIQSFHQGKHDQRYQFTDDDGKHKCRHLFTPFVHKGDTVVANEVLQLTFTPTYHKQRNMCIQIYSSDKRDIWYTCQPGVQLVASLTVEMPNDEGDKKREVKLTVDFTRTEIQIQAYDITSGKKMTAVVDFL